MIGCVLLVALAGLHATAEGAPSPPPPVAISSSTAISATDAQLAPCTPSSCTRQRDDSVLAPAFAPSHRTEAAAGDARSGVVGWIAKGVTAAINAFFTGLVTVALQPLLKLLAHTLLTTPTPDSLPRVGELWADSWQITLATYSLLIMVAGVLLMAHGSVQARYSLRELGPRIPLGFLAAGFSLLFATKAVELANALSVAVLGGGLDKNSAGIALREFVLSSFVAGGNIFRILLWGVVAVVLVALLVTYVVRVALTILLIAGAPLALMCHALPLTEGVARWWWRTFAGLLAIQVAQSAALVVGIRVFLTPGNFSPFGPTRDGFVAVLVVLALMYILFKIPFWILSSVRVSRGRSFAGRMVRAMVMYKTFGLLRSASGRPAVGRGGRGGRGPSATNPSPPPAQGMPPFSPRRRQAGRGGPQPGGRTASGSRRPPGPPLFLSPNQAAQGPGSQAPGQPITPTVAPAPGPPPLPHFQEPGDARSPGAATASSSRSISQPIRTAGPPAFRAPDRRAPGHGSSTPRRGFPPTPPAPTRFQTPAVDPSPPPRRAVGPPARAPFREPVHPLPPVRPHPPRRFPPPPPFFSSPPPPARPGEGNSR
ncbi:hypothetical protein [Streptomyces sp. NPDC059009]|uniref:hypothetical protein n=1 Tax=Streptomyces sp. NPDC059009 TaxID=3346694 RepID=UPI0036AA535A